MRPTRTPPQVWTTLGPSVPLTRLGRRTSDPDKALLDLGLDAASVTGWY